MGLYPSVPILEKYFVYLRVSSLTISEVLSKILNKILWFLFWVAASNVVKANRMMIAKFTMNAYKNSKITKTKKKKKWTGRET